MSGRAQSRPKYLKYIENTLYRKAKIHTMVVVASVIGYWDDSDNWNLQTAFSW